jgi:MFS family permease
VTRPAATLDAPAEPSGGLGAAYWRLWTATVVSRFGDALRGPALALVAAGLTRDPRTISLVYAAGFIPYLLFGLLSGALADRWDRRRALFLTDAIRCALVLTLAAVVLTGQATVLILLIFAFAMAAVATLFDSSSLAILPDLVPAESLAKANGRLQAGATVSGGFVGAPVAGLLFAAAAALPLALDALTFAVAAALAVTLPRGPAAATPPDRPALWREAAQGVRWLVHEPTLRLFVLLTTAANVVIGALLGVLVLLILEVFEVPAAAYGTVGLAVAAATAVGGLVASKIEVALGTLPTLRWILGGQTIALAALAIVHHAVPGTIALAAIFGAGSIWNVLFFSHQQRAVPRELLGRVGAASRVVGVVSAPIGATLGGVVAEAFGVPAVAAAGAAIFALMTAATWRALGRD